MNRLIPVLALLAALAPARTTAQELVPEPLSLAQALDRAQTHNPELRALRARANAGSLRVDATRKQNLPRLGIELGAQRTNNAAAAFASRLNASEFRAQDFELARLNSPNALSHLGTSLSLEIPLDIAGRVNLAASGQAALQRGFTEDLREAEATLRLQVTEAYFGAVLARRANEVTEKALAAARSREEVTKARFDEGLALKADLLRVRARRRFREADRAAQRAEMAVADALLARLMGTSNGPIFDLTDAPQPTMPIETVEVWAARAGSARPILRAAGERQAAATLAVQLEEKAAWPELTAQARLTDDRISLSGGGQSWAVGAALRWSVFDATRGKRLAAAIADELAVAEDGRAAKARVRFEVESGFRRLAAAQERLAAAAGGAAEGREALRVIQERRAQGLATLTDELETEAAAFAAELEEINAARTAVLAEAALERAAFQSHGSTIQ